MNSASEFLGEREREVFELKTLETHTARCQNAGPGNVLRVGQREEDGRVRIKFPTGFSFILSAG